MDKKLVFQGAATALITPTNESGVDYASLAKLIDRQIASGIQALVVCATTGEAPTLSDDEHCKVLEFAVDRAAGRLPIIAGTGSNDTRHAVMMTKYASAIGADAVLCVTPYYNKSTQTGLIHSFETIADESTVPMILYNVPSRTGTNLLPKTVATLARHPNIVGIKEASGNISQIVELFSLVGDRFHIYSGNDDQIVPILAMGGKGVISTVANVLPYDTQRICKLWFDGEIKEAAALQCKMLPLINALFSQVNPIPVKAAMAKLGLCEDHLRLPLWPMEEPYRSELYRCMEEWELI